MSISAASACAMSPTNCGSGVVKMTARARSVARMKWRMGASLDGVVMAGLVPISMNMATPCQLNRNAPDKFTLGPARSRTRVPGHDVQSPYPFKVSAACRQRLFDLRLEHRFQIFRRDRADQLVGNAAIAADDERLRNAVDAPFDRGAAIGVGTVG